jgi:hypothetical protein
MSSHRGDVGPEFCQKPENFGKPRFEGLKARPQGGTVRRGIPSGLPRVALEHPVKVFRLPSERHGQGLERAAAAAALDRVPLEFPHDGHGHVRALGKLTLTPAELADTAADSPGNRSPVLRIAFRHAFLRAPLPAPRLAVHFATPHQAETSRKQTKAFRNI